MDRKDTAIKSYVNLKQNHQKNILSYVFITSSMNIIYLIVSRVPFAQNVSQINLNYWNSWN